MTHPADLDPITAEVIRSAFDNITSEMSSILLRTSGSPILTESRDFSTVLFDADLNQIGTSGYVLLHVAASRRGVRTVASARARDVRPGDGFICNDPHSSGALHQGDVGIVMPIFYGGVLVGWTFSNAHLADVGGSAISGFAPGARDTFSEALRFPGTRIVTEGRLNPEWVGYISNNVRLPLSVISDLRSLVAACNVGSERMCALIDEYGLDSLKAYIQYNIELTERALRARIAALPDGVFKTYEFVEYDGFDTADLYPVFCEMTVQGDRLQFGFSGCPQIAAFVNCGRAGLEGSLMAVLMCQFAPDIPFNEGFWNCLDIDLGEPGSIVNPVVPAPVCSGHASAGMRVGRMVQEAISHACAASGDPDIRARASGVNSAAIAMGFWVGKDHGGHPTMFLPFGMIVGIGGAAQSVGDGQDGSGMASTLAIKWSDVEVHELDSPVMALWRRRRPNAGGAGATRGGVSIDEAFILHGTNEFVGINYINSLEIPARGFAGGLPGGGGLVMMIRGTQVQEMLRRGELPSSPEKIGGVRDVSIKGNQTNIRFSPTDVVRGYAGGSGGVGDPFLRAPEDIEADLNTGTITSAAAEVLFGAVVIGHDPYRVDREATWQKRNQLRAKIVPEATVDLAAIPRGTICQGVILKDDDWVCGRCDRSLASSTDSWVGATVTIRRDLADLFEEAETMIRRIREHPAVLVEHYCPNCASCLQADVQLTGCEYDVPAFQLLRARPSNSVEDVNRAAGGFLYDAELVAERD